MKAKERKGGVVHARGRARVGEERGDPSTSVLANGSENAVTGFTKSDTVSTNHREDCLLLSFSSIGPLFIFYLHFWPNRPYVEADNLYRYNFSPQSLDTFQFHPHGFSFSHSAPRVA